MMCLTATAARLDYDEDGFGTLARAKHRRGGRWVIAAVTIGVLAVATAGTTFAAYRYDASTSDRILPGVSVGGVAFKEMKRDVAVRTLGELADEKL